MATVRRTESFQQSVATLVGASRSVPMLSGLEWVLARKPDAHDQVPGSDLRVAVTQVGSPTLRVFYRWDVETDVVTLEHVELLA